MRIRFFGVRGFFPTPGKETASYGGNTSCVAIDLPSLETMLIFDAGTGIRQLGETIIASPEEYKVHLFISHIHWDHIQGFPYFLPNFIKNFKLHIYGPKLLEGSVLEKLTSQVVHQHLPVKLGDIQANIHFRELEEESFSLGAIQVQTFKLNHPVVCLGYRVRFGAKSVTYATDHEPYFEALGESSDEAPSLDDMNRRYRNFIAGSDLLIADGQYLPDEYDEHQGWGHSTVAYAVNQAARAGVKKLVFTHHDPNRTDSQLDKITHHYQAILKRKQSDLKLLPAHEGLEIII